MKRKLIFLITFLFLSLNLFGFSPQDTLEKNINTQLLTKQIIEEVEKNNYTKAMELIEQLDTVNNFLLNNFKNNLLITYKKQAIENINKYIENSQFESAKKVITILKKYYINDYQINKIQESLYNKIMQLNLQEYSGPIEHLFTHCLLADPSVALNKNNNMYLSYDTDCITKNEFKKILQKLYENNYILIDINSIFTDIDGIITKNKLYLPQGKKPLIFSFDDVNYDHKKMHKGMIDKLILDNDGNIATYTSKASDNRKISYDNEFIVILENFISLHPDFSFMGARGTICLTGYDGILGYRTQKGSINRQKEIEKVKPIIQKLKDLGWTFASHSYGHYHMKKISDEKFEEELQKWQDEVASLVGETSIYVYPYGEWVVNEDNNLSQKHQLLQKYGFKLFCGVGINQYYSYLPNTKNVLFMDRTPIDGYTLRNRKEQLSRLFNTEEVFDYKYRQ